MRADSNVATVGAPCKALNTGQDAILDRSCLRFLTGHLVLVVRICLSKVNTLSIIIYLKGFWGFGVLGLWL